MEGGCFRIWVVGGGVINIVGLDQLLGDISLVFNCFFVCYFLYTHHDYPAEGITIIPTLEAGLSRCASDPTVNRVFVIGGAQVYETAIEHHKLDAIYLTRVINTAHCDAFFPTIPERFKLSQHSGIIDTPEKIQIQFEVWRRA